MKCDVLVIGAGIHGTSAAFHIAARGLKVVILERDYVARHASGASAGGVRRVRRKPAELPLAERSLAIWKDLSRQLGEDSSFVVSGHIALAEDGPALAALEARAKLTAELGYTFEELLTPTQVKALIPSLQGPVMGGLVARDDGFANPPQATHALRRGAERHGATVLEGAEVTALDRKPDGWVVTTSKGVFEAGYIANCAGGWGPRISALIGDSVPIKFKASLMTVTSRVAPFLKPVVGRSKKALSLKQMQNGTVVIGGGFQGRPDLEVNTSDVEYDDVGANMTSALEIFPQLGCARIIRNWTGLEGHTIDALPVIGFSNSDDRMVHSYAYCGSGFQLGPGSGSVLAELVTRGMSNVPLEAFRPDRFNQRVADDGPGAVYEFPSALIKR